MLLEYISSKYHLWKTDSQSLWSYMDKTSMWYSLWSITCIFRNLSLVICEKVYKKYKQFWDYIPRFLKHCSVCLAHVAGELDWLLPDKVPRCPDHSVTISIILFTATKLCQRNISLLGKTWLIKSILIHFVTKKHACVYQVTSVLHNLSDFIERNCVTCPWHSCQYFYSMNVNETLSSYQ